MTKQGYMRDHTLLDGAKARGICNGLRLRLLTFLCLFLLSSVNAQDKGKSKAKEKPKEEQKEKIKPKPEPKEEKKGESKPKEEKKEKPKEKPARKPDFSVAVKGDEQSLSSEFTAKAGKWKVGESPKCFQLIPLPLIESRIEFGPSYKNTELTLQVEGWAKSGKRAYPRMGIGLFGKNGFFLKVFPAQKRIELVRRGVVLKTAKFKWKSGVRYVFELSVKAKDDDWAVTGRVWRKKGKRPKKPQLNHVAWSDELLFPLSGRSSAVATAFSGLPISFNKVAIFKKEEEPAPDAEGIKKEVQSD